MDEKSRKVAAALAAVSQYLDGEAGCPAAPAGAPAVSAWAVSGRQQIMNTRTLIAARLWK